MNLREFGDWSLKNGIVATPVGTYSGQCVSLIQQLLDQVMGIPFKARGNAKDWATNPDVLSHFDKLPVGTTLQPGDILVYGANYGGGFGHIAFIDANVNYFDQNGIIPLHCGWRSTPFKGYICILRCKTPFEIGNPIQNIKFSVKVTGEATVRNQPTTNGAIVGSKYLNPGDEFLGIAEVQGQDPYGDGRNIWIQSKFGNFVWAGNLEY